MFRFGFDAFVGDMPFMSMVDGCAGFFTQEELDQGKGILKDESPKVGKYIGGFQPVFSSLVNPIVSKKAGLSASRRA